MEPPSDQDNQQGEEPLVQGQREQENAAPSLGLSEMNFINKPQTLRYAAFRAWIDKRWIIVKPVADAAAAEARAAMPASVIWLVAAAKARAEVRAGSRLKHKGFAAQRFTVEASSIVVADYQDLGRFQALECKRKLEVFTPLFGLVRMLAAGDVFDGTVALNELLNLTEGVR
jgi:hypothetical protein